MLSLLMSMQSKSRVLLLHYVEKHATGSLIQPPAAACHQLMLARLAQSRTRGSRGHTLSKKRSARAKISIPFPNPTSQILVERNGILHNERGAEGQAGELGENILVLAARTSAKLVPLDWMRTNQMGQTRPLEGLHGVMAGSGEEDSRRRYLQLGSGGCWCRGIRRSSKFLGIRHGGGEHIGII